MAAIGLKQALLLATSVLSGLCFAGRSYGLDDAEGLEPITVVGERRSYDDDEIGSATRTDTNLRDVPQSVSVITNDLIENQNMRSMADVVRYVPGVSMGQGEGHRDAPTLRGNSSTADFFVDGVRDDVQYYRDLYNAERIEVLKGPNAMIFGRGGGGGVINRVTEWANWTPHDELNVTLGAFEQVRGAADLGHTLSDEAAVRLNAMYERADSYRDFVNLERWGANPTSAFRFGDSTAFRLGYEHFSDDRVVDRGVPSQDGRPWDGSRAAFFGNPFVSYTEAQVDAVSAFLDHDFSDALTIRNRTQYADYHKFYQNIHANSAVNSLGDVVLQGYNSSTERQNFFNQTDLIWRAQAGGIGHTVLAGFEFGQQDTDNTRSQNFTGLPTVNVSNPTTTATGAIPALFQTDNTVEARVAAIYLQDQIALSDQWQLVAGVRFDRFEVDFDNHVALSTDFSREDNLVSPRLGVIYRPIDPVSFYVSYSVSYLPQSGDQFATLTGLTSNFDPEEFRNFEVGVKWDVLPELTVTAAIYQLHRTNTPRSPNPPQTVLTGEQRSEGFELGIAGSVTDIWQIAGGYSYQNVEITSGDATVPAGRVIPLTPEHTFALWNMVRFTPRFGAGVGVTHQTESFASINNTVTLPEFTRVDAALFFAVTDTVEAQLNVENVFDEEYWATAHNDNNITPGSPTAARLTLRTRF